MSGRGHGTPYCLTHLHHPTTTPREDQVLRDRADAWSKVEQMAKENPMVSHQTSARQHCLKDSFQPSPLPGKSGDPHPNHSGGGQAS